MTVEECATFNAQVDLDGLQAYRAAIAARTREVVAALNPEQLEQLASADHLQATFADGVIGSARALARTVLCRAYPCLVARLDHLARG